jgi:hypothetical protein
VNTGRTPRRTSYLLAAAFTLGGAVLFAYVVRRAGVSEIIDGIQRVGWGLLAILALAGVRFVVRAGCWRLCMPPDRSLSFGRTLTAFLAGDAVGNVTPFGLVASEPAKVFLTRHHLATRESVTSLAVENVIYAASVVTMLVAGIAVALAAVPLPVSWRWAAAGGLCGVACLVAVAVRVLRGTWDVSRGPRPRWRARLADVRQAVVGVLAAPPRRLWRAFVLDMSFHALGTLEVFLTLGWLLGDRSPTLVQAIVFETVNRGVTVGFKFVPFRIGVDEAFSGVVAPLLAVDASAGVALAVVRKVRNLFWTGIGLAVIAAHPVRMMREADRHETGSVPRL